MTERPKLMYEIVKEKADLAAIYAEDGAYLSALRVIGDLHTKLKNHVKRLKAQGLVG